MVRDWHEFIKVGNGIFFPGAVGWEGCSGVREEKEQLYFLKYLSVQNWKAGLPELGACH